MSAQLEKPAARALAELLALGGLSDRPGGTIDITGQDPYFPTTHRVGEAAAAILAAQGAAIAEIWRRRSGRRQHVAVDVGAAALSLESVTLMTRRGYTVPYTDINYPLTNFHPTRDGRAIHLHAGYPHLRNGLLELLDCPNSIERIRAKVAQWNAFELEDAIAARGLCGNVARTRQEWLDHPQGAWLAAQPVVSVERIGDSPPEPLKPAARPLSGIRVIDLTDVLAGPTATRTLAEQGATVLRIRPPDRPIIPAFILDTGHGKLSTVMDLKRQPEAARMRALLAEADIFAQNYRPGAVAGLGFSVEDAVKLRPGIICMSLSCFGEGGPWNGRRGWEQLAQAASGMAVADGSIAEPRVSPVIPTDYTTGYLAAYGMAVALLRRATEGGSYHVRVSLSRTALWIQSLGGIGAKPAGITVPPETIRALETTRDTPEGRLRFLGPVARFEETRAYWELPSPPMAAHEPVWPLMPSQPDGPAVPVDFSVPR
ncbi:CoA transferase [Paramagnetospirillum magneticum]|uniref:Predicted acyl-CoA transferase/carnitine dehydratase n=1 Tax=Paramagnetospirillum magneticum (strain ATCC 700264 / AMB-1) TaxID=342108 RepID=Q2W9E9_PARM1|nr:CoA transferase [Paramagnetospirillum magneticum]BAE49526.1 Predicted acyl-CoA transferase/carnitine dehydratase [Paramagnetospirillum magneticum AMB-1]